MAEESKERKRPKIIPKRVPMPEQDPMERIKNFNEVTLGYTVEQALAEAERCIGCPKPPCVKGCPVEVPIKDFIASLKERKFEEAIAKINEKSLLPAVCGRVCPQEDQCEKFCVIGKKFEPVSIGRLERFVADKDRESGKKRTIKLPPPTGKKVAIVGSGPAGLTAASDLAKFGHKVTVFEALHKPGGVLVYGIPEFRLPKKIVASEVNSLREMGVEIRLDVVIGKLYTVDELLEDYDAVFIGTGAGLPVFPNIEGINLNGVYSANEFLTRVNLMKAYNFPEYDTPIKVGQKVTVVGGGNVAMDSVRTALRLGAKEASIIYRRSEEEMPARLEEIHHAKEEGVKFELLTSPIKLVSNGQGWIKALECVRMQLGEPDESGRRRPIPIENSEFQIETDITIMAIGTGANPLVPKSTKALDLNKRGYIVADSETGLTSREGVFAGGDIVTGSATVILAMGAGRKAASAIHRYLMGQPVKEEDTEETVPTS
jgi:glutamate synthase (NADPH/NADH) small chain